MSELVNPESSIETNNQPNIETKTAVLESKNENLTENAEESSQDRDWRKWRENRKKEREEAARIDAARIKAEKEAEALRQALESVINKPTKSISQENFNDDIEESEEARIDKRIAQALHKQQLEYEAKIKQAENQNLPERLRTIYKDFDQICTDENVDYLEYHHPELYKSLKRQPNGFDKWADVYSAIKRYIPNPTSQADQKKAEKNLAKPQSLSHSMTPSGDSSGSSYKDLEKQRAERWKEMQKSLKSLS